MWCECHEDGHYFGILSGELGADPVRNATADKKAGLRAPRGSAREGDRERDGWGRRGQRQVSGSLSARLSPPAVAGAFLSLTRVRACAHETMPETLGRAWADNASITQHHSRCHAFALPAQLAASKAMIHMPILQHDKGCRNTASQLLGAGVVIAGLVAASPMCSYPAPCFHSPDPRSQAASIKKRWLPRPARLPAPRPACLHA